MTHYILANFGGPRNLREIEPFLSSLLTDREVVRTPLPQAVHTPLFNWIAKRRSKRMAPCYGDIGGCSPIYEDTEAVATALRTALGAPVTTFHRYLPATHQAFLREISSSQARFRLFPMFPQFTYATTGSIALWMRRHLQPDCLRRLQFIKSYPKHPAFIAAQAAVIRDFLAKENVNEEELFFIFSAHGLPKSFVTTGDPYQSECESSVEALMQSFPRARGVLSYQSKFGPGEWLRPYTSDVCDQIGQWSERRHIVFVPISFTSDHIETLYEVEYEYMPIIRAQKRRVYRAPSLNRHPEWLKAIPQVLSEAEPMGVNQLMRKRRWQIRKGTQA